MAYDYSKQIAAAKARGATPAQIAAMLKDRPDIKITDATGLLDDYGFNKYSNVEDNLAEAHATIETPAFKPPVPKSRVGTLLDGALSGIKKGFTDPSTAGLLNDAFSKTQEAGNTTWNVLNDKQFRDDVTASGNEGLGTLPGKVADAAAEVTGLKQREDDILAGDKGAIDEGLTVHQQAAISSPNISSEAAKDPTTAKVAVQKDLAADGAKGVAEATKGDPDALSAWGKFTDEFDLLTLGMSLLATNDGSSNLAVNMGKSLALSRQASQSYKELAKKDAKDAREEGRADKDSESKRIAAEAAMLRAMASARGNGKADMVDNKALLDVTSQWLQNQGISSDDAGGASSQFATDVASYRSRTGASAEKAQKDMFNMYVKRGVAGFEDNPLGFLPFVGDYK